MKLGFITFYSKSFESRAEVLLNSLEKYEPNSSIIAFELEKQDLIGSYIQGLAKMRLVKMKEILEENKDLDALVLLGADCEIFSKLLGIRSMLSQGYSCIITPHVTSPLLNDNKSPSMAQIYQTGHANADIFVINNDDTGLEILNWLIEQDISDKKQEGIFYEQTWMSALPFIFKNVGIIRHEGYNVGYWNIVEREMHLNNPFLEIAQYSGYVKGKPEIMSKYQTRYKPEDLPQQILEFYKRYDNLIKE